ncbi:sugar transferase [Rhodobacteraceae bacterium]|nr:sugar transferase [Paracoccaceae bacterium]
MTVFNRAVEHSVAVSIDSQRESFFCSKRFKRSFDVTFAVFALASAAVVMLVIAICLRLCSKDPVWFAHERVGLDGKTFKCLKFRTMYSDSDAILAQHLVENPEARVEYNTYLKLRDDPRVIGFIGKFLRKTSLDELPQFINVLRGEMSIVGPRPVTEPEIKLYGSAAPKVLSVRPGITGLWQVSGRNRFTFDERVTIDQEYVRNQSFGLDLSIICQTVVVLLLRRDGY